MQLPPPPPLAGADDGRALLCPVCGEAAQLTSTRVLWSQVQPEQGLYICPNYSVCKTYVRCHAGTLTPLGTLAGPRLRRLRAKAHEEFDPLWSNTDPSTGRAMLYALAAEEMGVPEFHIGWLNEDECLLFIEKIPDIEIALDAKLHGMHINLAQPDEALIDILWSLSHEGSGARRMSFPFNEFMALGATGDEMVRLGLVHIDSSSAGVNLVSVTPYGWQKLTTA